MPIAPLFVSLSTNLCNDAQHTINSKLKILLNIRLLARSKIFTFEVTFSQITHKFTDETQVHRYELLSQFVS